MIDPDTKNDSGKMEGANDTEPYHSPDSGIPVLRQLCVALGILVVIFSIPHIARLTHFVFALSQSADVHVSTLLTEVDTHALKKSPFANTVLTAKAAFVWDVKLQKTIFNKNADDSRPIASITKLMTSLVAYELLDKKSNVNISTDAIRTSGDDGFIEGEQFAIEDLIDLTLVASSNDGATALSASAGLHTGIVGDPKKIFIEAMNIRARELGLSNTSFSNQTGLDLSKTEAGAYSSARDVAFLMEYILMHYPELLSKTGREEARIYNTGGAYHAITNTNKVVAEIDGLIASKTGYTELAGGNLVIAFNAGLNRPFIISVLGSSEEERFADIMSLVERTRTYVDLEAKQ